MALAANGLAIGSAQRRKVSGGANQFGTIVNVDNGTYMCKPQLKSGNSLDASQMPSYEIRLRKAVNII